MLQIQVYELTILSSTLTSLSLSRTNTHTPSPSLLFNPALSLPLSLCLTLSFSLPLLPVSLFLPCARVHSCALLPLTRFLSLARSFLAGFFSHAHEFVHARAFYSRTTHHICGKKILDAHVRAHVRVSLPFSPHPFPSPSHSFFMCCFFFFALSIFCASMRMRALFLPPSHLLPLRSSSLVSHSFLPSCVRACVHVCTFYS